MHHRKSHSQIKETTGRTMPFAARFYDAVMTLLTLGREKRFRNSALELARIKEGERVLDVGCGTGTLALLAKERVGPVGKVAGIDATPEMIERARNKAARKGLDVQFEQGIIEQLDFPDASFDVVLSTLMMHHLPQGVKEQGLRESGRVLRPGGRLLIVDFGGRGHSLGTLIHGDQAKAMGNQLAGLVLDAGFENVESGKAGMGGLIYVKGARPGARKEASV